MKVTQVWLQKLQRSKVGNVLIMWESVKKIPCRLYRYFVAT